MPEDHRSLRVYALPAAALAVGGLYYVYGAVDRVGLQAQHAHARVASKLVAPGSTTYHTSTVGGRTWTQSSVNPEVHVLTFEVEGERAGAAVSPEFYATVHAGEVMRIEFTRTRFSNQLVIDDVRRERE